MSERIEGPEPELGSNAIRVLEARCLGRDDQGHIVETPRRLFERVAHALAEVEQRFGASPQEIERMAERFYGRMARLELLPNSPTLVNAGRPLGQLAACFVLPVGDSLDEIFGALRDA